MFENVIPRFLSYVPVTLSSLVSPARQDVFLFDACTYRRRLPHVPARGGFMWTLGSTVLGGISFVWGAPRRQGEALRVIRALQRAALGVVLAVIVLLSAYPDAFLRRISVYSETLDPRSPASELLHRSGDYPLNNFLAAFTYPLWPYGYGIGVTSLGVQYIARFFHVRPPIGPVESGFGTIVLGMGIGGLILWITMSAPVSAWKVARRLKGSPWFPLAFMIFLLPMTYAAMTGYQDFILNAYLWLSLGILFRLPRLALSAESSSTPVPQPATSWKR